MKKTRQQTEALADALDDTPIDAAEAKAAVDQLGVDVPVLAAKLRATVAEADRKARFAAASLAYAEELAKLEMHKHAPAPRDQHLATMKRLIARVPREQVAMHFLKYESATDDELGELVRSLQHLLGDGDEDE